MSSKTLPSAKKGVYTVKSVEKRMFIKRFQVSRGKKILQDKTTLTSRGFSTQRMI